MSPRVLPSLLLCGLALALQGCVAQVAYLPNDQLVHEVGIEQAQSLFCNILNRARRPAIHGTSVTPESYIYNYTRGRRPRVTRVARHQKQVQMYFANISRVDVHVNQRVQLFDVSGRRIDTYDLLNQEDCRRFADLVMSFKSSGRAWPTPDNPRPLKEADTYTDPEPVPGTEDGGEKEPVDELAPPGE